MSALRILSIAALAPPAAAAAQDPAAEDAAQMSALEAAIPDQSWYPPGYRDLRLAAEAELAEAPKPARGDRSPPAEVNIRACATGGLNVDALDPAMRDKGRIAIEMAKIHTALVDARFPSYVYGAPLDMFERDRIAGKVAKDDLYRELVSRLNFDARPPEPILPLVVAVDDCPPPPPPPAEAAGPSSKPKKKKPRKVGAAPPPPMPKGIVLVTEPPAGELLLIDAFAFKVCVRKLPNPWGRFDCRWNEIQTGVAKPLAGRFVYQVRWSDGTVRRGTREISAGESGTVTLRKTGS